VQAKPLEMHTMLFFPPYNTDLLKLLFKWGMTTEKNYLNEQIELWTKYTKNENIESLKSFRLVVLALEEDVSTSYNNTYNNYNSYPQTGGMPRHYRNNYDSYNNNNHNNYYRNDRTYYYDSLTSSQQQIFWKYQKFIKDFLWAKRDLVHNYQETIIWMDRILYHPGYAKSKNVLFETIAAFEECKRIRKAVRKHGSKIRRTRNRNKNVDIQTIKQNLNTVNINVNPEAYINKLLSEILELAKKPQFTKEEKANFKSRPITIKKSASNVKTKISQLRDILESMKQILGSR
jgi:hypothetical protein